ncbi:MAG: hypothetical protein IJL97_01365, partial [Lachnospiraceae bacterium]|nr:hypothetical protein [Lachnospiraceae bacterium]
MNHQYRLKRFVAVLLAAVLIAGILPSASASASGLSTQLRNEPAAQTDASVPLIRTADGDIEADENWNDVYPYGTFAFGAFQSDVAEPGALTPEGDRIPDTIILPVYRLGGTTGKATARITYGPAVTDGESEDGLNYDYAASGKSDIKIEYEAPKAITEYQNVGMPDELLNMQAADGVMVTFDDPGEEFDISASDEVKLYAAYFDEDGNDTILTADTYRWQITNGVNWEDIEEAEGNELPVSWGDIWDFDNSCPKDIDFRLIYSIDGEYFCSESLLGEIYEPVAQINEIPEDLPEDPEDNYYTLEMDDDYDVYEFELTFADGETVKYIRISALDDELAELPEMGLFTITGCEGGELSEICNTHTVMVSDNDEAEASTLGFTVSEIEVNREDGTAYAVIKREGGKSYNVTIDYETVEGTAKEGEDYSPVSGTLAFAGSVDEIKIPIELIQTADDEERSFTIRLSNLKGGGTDELCSLLTDELTITLRGSAEYEGGLSEGQNLATVLTGSEGKSAEANVTIGTEALISDAEELTGDYVGEPDDYVLEGTVEFERVPVYADGDAQTQGAQPLRYEDLPVFYFQRSDGYDSSNYWHDWEQSFGDPNFHNGIVPNNTYDASNNKNYKFVTERTPDKNGNGYVQTTAASAGGFNFLRIGCDYQGSAVIGVDNAGHYYDKVEFYTELNYLGRKWTGDLEVDDYCRPTVIWFYGPNDYIGNATKRASTNYGINKDNGNFTAPFYTSGSGTSNSTSASYSGMSLDYNTGFYLEFLFWMCNQWGDDRDGDERCSPQDDYTNDTNIRLYTLRFRRRQYETTHYHKGEMNQGHGIPIILYTANDDNEIGDNGWAPITDKTTYLNLKPEITIVPGEGGVSTTDNLYVGSKIQIDASKIANYEIAPNGVYITNSEDEPMLGVSAKTVNGNQVYIIDTTWMEYGSDVLTDRFTIHVVLQRKQTITVDMTPSIPFKVDEEGNVTDQRDMTQEGADTAWRAFKETSDNTISMGYSGVGTVNNYVRVGDDYVSIETPGSFYTNYWDISPDNFDQLTLDNDNAKYSWTYPITDLQWINFHQDPDDRILFNGHSYNGDETIPITAEDLDVSNMVFRFYDSEYLDAISPMGVDLDHTAIYYDASGNGVIDGTYSSTAGFILTPDPENGILDEYVGVFKGEYPDSTFAPLLEDDGTLHQVFIKAYYSARPRAYRAPESGAHEDDTAQILPAFTSAVTDEDQRKKQTKEQLSYRYIYGFNTDGHPMWGAPATAMSYIDIPLGGDVGEVIAHTSTTPVYDSEGNIADYKHKTTYDWTPVYVNNIIIPFDNPTAITSNNNITGGAVPIAGESPAENEDHTITFSAAGLNNLNGYLASFVDRTIYALGIQEEFKSIDEISSSDDIAFETITHGDVYTIPNADSVMNMSAAENDQDANDSAAPGADAGYPEFGSDLGTELPSLDFPISDYVTIVMDGYTVGFTVGIPLYKKEKSSYSGSEQSVKMDDGSTYNSHKDGDGTLYRDITSADGKTETHIVEKIDPNNHNRKTVETQVIKNENGQKKYENRHEVQTREAADKPFKYESHTSDTNAPETPTAQATSKRQEFKKGMGEANGAGATLASFISACVKPRGQKSAALKDAWNGMVEDDSFKNAKNGNATCRKA